MKLNFKWNMLLLYFISVIGLIKRCSICNRDKYCIAQEPITSPLFDMQCKKSKEKSDLLMDRIHAFAYTLVLFDSLGKSDTSGLHWLQ